MFIYQILDPVAFREVPKKFRFSSVQRSFCFNFNLNATLVLANGVRCYKKEKKKTTGFEI